MVQTVTIGPRKSVLIAVIWAIVILLGLIAILVRDIGPAVELFGAGAMTIWLLLETIRLMASSLTVELDDAMLAIRRGGKLVFKGRYYSAKRTVIPIKGIAFAIEPMPLLGAMMMNFSNVFILNVRRDRVALPGVFLTGLDAVWAAIPPQRQVK